MSPARSPLFRPGPARRSMGPGWHGTGVQAVLGPHPRPTGRHGTARKITAGPRTPPSSSCINRDPPGPHPHPNPNPIPLPTAAALDTRSVARRSRSSPLASSRRSIFAAGATVVLGSGDIAAAPSPLPEFPAPSVPLRLPFYSFSSVCR